MARIRIQPADVPAIDPKTGLWLQDWYDIMKGLERFGLPDLADTLPKTVATLPAAGHAGARNFVTDATVTTFGTIVAGGSANKVPVYDDGTNWRIG
jgi:hypothetical protein